MPIVDFNNTSELGIEDEPTELDQNIVSAQVFMTQIEISKHLGLRNQVLPIAIQVVAERSILQRVTDPSEYSAYICKRSGIEKWNEPDPNLGIERYESPEFQAAVTSTVEYLNRVARELVTKGILIEVDITSALGDGAQGKGYLVQQEVMDYLVDRWNNSSKNN